MVGGHVSIRVARQGHNLAVAGHTFLRPYDACDACSFEELFAGQAGFVSDVEGCPALLLG